jgi:hypothetical protein
MAIMSFRFLRPIADAVRAATAVANAAAGPASRHQLVIPVFSPSGHTACRLRVSTARVTEFGG